MSELYKVISPIKKAVIDKKNAEKSWEYGYDPEHDVVVISKDGTIGEVYLINSVKIALPPKPVGVEHRTNKWKPSEYPKELARIKTIFEWNERDNAFKSKWIDYIEQEFERRENGHWFYNNKKPTYITGTHYMYLQWTKIDVGLPEFRESNRIFFIFWEACKADSRCFGMCYLKNRRSGFSFMSSAEIVNQATITKNSRFGILSKTGQDAKIMFTDKVVPISSNYPFFFKPIQDGMDRPKTELAYRVPAKKITRKNMSEEDEDMEGLDTSIDWKNTADNSYDGEKLKMLVHDECLDPDTLVLCDGFVFKPISEIKVGDKVYVEGGFLKTVVKTTSGETEMYRVKQKWSKDYIVSENHRLYLEEYKYCKKTKSAKREVVILTPKEYLSLSRYKKQHTFSVKSKGIEFEDKDITIHPYLLGLWIGDGRKSSFTIIVNKEKDQEILTYLGRIADMLNIPFELKQHETSKSCVYFSFKGINSELKKIGVLNNKHIPQSYMTSSIDTRLQILAGIIDTDGYVDHKKKIVSIGMSNGLIIDQIRILALSCGLSCSEVLSKKTNFNTDAYFVNISGDLSSIPTIVERKSMTGFSKSYTNRRCGVDVEPIGLGKYCGIQVDSVDDNGRRIILSDFTLTLNSGKWEKPVSIEVNWRVTKTCLRLGAKIIGKCMMGSTSNALPKGGQQFKDIYYDSNPANRNANGQTKSGLYSLFIPMEWNFEGYIDEFGMPVLETPQKPVRGIDGSMIYMGVIEYWNNEVAGLKNDSDALNEFYRQYPRTESHAFRDESKQSLFNLTKIYQQIDYNDSIKKDGYVVRGNFHWKDGKQDTEVVWTPEKNGRFWVSWIPPVNLRNNVLKRGDKFFPMNEQIGAFGCDPYDISGAISGGSNGALHGLTKMSMDPKIPSNTFFLEYVSRPQTAEIFFEDVLMACFFYGMPLLAENNKPRLLYHFKNRGYRAFAMDRPDKQKEKLSKTEKEIGGIPSSSEDIKQAHASMIETYIEKYVGIDSDGHYRDSDEMGNMFFNRTLEDWARFDITDRTKYDASISSGLALMACYKHTFLPEIKKSKISINFAKYSNNGLQSEIVKRQ